MRDIQEQFPPIPSTDSADNSTLADIIGNKNDTIDGNSLFALSLRDSNHIVTKTITLNINNGTQSLNCFQVVGTVRIARLYAEITDATTLTNCTAAFFELDDGAAQQAITLNNGVLSGMAVGTFVAKTATAGNTMSIANNATGVVIEPVADKRAFNRFFITQKIGVNTYIRFTYTSTDTPANAQIKVWAEYRAMNSGTLVSV